MSTQDQWKENGVCSLCRRKDYCRKPCTAVKRRRTKAINLFVNAMVDVAKIEMMNEFVFDAIENGGKKTDE